MKLTNTQRHIVLFAMSLLLFGCSAKQGGVAVKSKATEKAKEEVVVEAPKPAGKMDLATFKPLTAESTKEETFNYAVALMTNERFTEAAALLLPLTQKHPELAGPYTNLGICYFYAKQYDKASDAFKQSLARKPNNAVALDYQARAEKEAGRFDAARDLYLKAISADPNYAPVQRNLGILYDIYLGDPKTALAYYQQYQKLLPEPDKQVDIWIKDLTKRTSAANKNATTSQEKSP